MITIAGSPVAWMRLSLPLVGTWVADVVASADVAIEGAVSIEDDDEDAPASYVGSVVSGAVVSTRWQGLVVGGTGGLRGNVEARSYHDVDARRVLSELCEDAGEALSSASTRAVLTSRLSYWTRAAGRASVALSALCDALGATWRVLPTGHVWVGTETWPEAGAVVELDRDPAEGSRLLAPESIALAPGVTLGGVRVGRVEHLVDQHLRTTAWEAA